jgi:hypothetical protein
MFDCLHCCVALQRALLFAMALVRCNQPECLLTWDKWRQLTSSPCLT